ncbi:unnamed protein product [Hermetia illucens]|uniref:Uncharacterized protein n=1 Tax=Hermetia illucens TaxID=343691 RepID=A0A7R8V7N0_HERIL|nr:uncharacterized protein LOC119660072 [Hermetia illucens]CAD7093622.1 unnamed protein product [Hermetia illucens]
MILQRIGTWLLIASLMFSASLTMRKDFKIRIEEVRCFADPRYGQCNFTKEGDRHLSALIHLNRVLGPTVIFQISIVEVNSNARRTVVFNRKYNFCDEKVVWLTQYASMFINKVIRDFLGTGWTCPMQPANFSIRNYTIDSDLLPVHFFYKPNVYFLTNGSFFRISENVSKLVFNVVFELKIIKLKNKTNSK